MDNEQLTTNLCESHKQNGLQSKGIERSVNQEFINLPYNKTIHLSINKLCIEIIKNIITLFNHNQNSCDLIEQSIYFLLKCCLSFKAKILCVHIWKDDGKNQF